MDFLKLSLEDAAARSAQHLIAEGELSPEQAYELEWDVANRPVFIWENQGETRIPAGGRATLSVRCLGKVGW